MHALLLTCFLCTDMSAKRKHDLDASNGVKKARSSVTEFGYETTSSSTPPTQPAHDDVMREIVRYIRENHPDNAYQIWIVFRQSLIQRLQDLRTSVLESTRWSTVKSEDVQRLRDHHDLLIQQFIVMLVKYVHIEQQSIIALWTCMFQGEVVVWTCLVDAILSNNEEMCQFWHGVFVTCRSMWKRRYIFTLIEGSEHLSKCTYDSPYDFLTSQIKSVTSVDEYTVQTERQFRWLIRICGKQFNSLPETSYMIRQHYNNWICEQLQQQQQQKHGRTKLPKSLVAILDEQTDLWTESSVMVRGGNGVDTDDDADVVYFVDLAASPILLRHYDEIVENGGDALKFYPDHWWTNYLMEHESIPLNQDTQLLDQLVYLTSSDRFFRQLLEHVGISYNSTQTQNGQEWIVPSHGSIVRWLWNGMRRSVWPKGTSVGVGQDFVHLNTWLDHVFYNSTHIEVFAALYVFKTPQSVTLYNALSQHAPDVIAMITLQYLASQAGSGGQYDTARALLIV